MLGETVKKMLIKTLGVEPYATDPRIKHNQWPPIWPVKIGTWYFLEDCARLHYSGGDLGQYYDVLYSDPDFISKLRETIL